MTFSQHIFIYPISLKIDIPPIIVYIRVMESTVTAIEMRRKFGGILDRVVQKGEHITIMRGSRALATLIPVQEHVLQCSSKDRIKTIEEALAQMEEWKKRNPRKAKRMAREKAEDIVRKMRDTRWSSLTHR